MRRQWRRKRARFEEGSRFSGAKRTETGWADGVFLHHAGRKDFFDTLKIGAPYHRRGMGACEGVLRKSRSVHGGSGRFVARGRAADGEKLLSAEGGTWGQMGGNPVIARDTGFGGAKRGGPEKRRRVGAGRLQLRNGWIYVNLRNKTFRANADGGGAPAVLCAFYGAAWPGS